jgi:AcrR family transcriptional regulator
MHTVFAQCKNDLRRSRLVPVRPANKPTPAPGSAAWWHARATRPRRNSTLTAERIVDAAIELLDSDGLEVFTMRSLGKRLGTAAGSLYRHFESRQAVLVALHDKLIGEGIDFNPPGETWPEQIANLVRSQHRILTQRPYLAAIWSTTEQLGPNAMRARERALQLILAGGLAPELAARGYLTLLHYTIGFAALERSYRFRTPERRRATEQFFHALPQNE